MIIIIITIIVITVMFDNRYRSISGACNNLENPEWGTAGRQLVRILPPDYEVTLVST